MPARTGDPRDRAAFPDAEFSEGGQVEPPVGVLRTFRRADVEGPFEHREDSATHTLSEDAW